MERPISGLWSGAALLVACSGGVPGSDLPGFGDTTGSGGSDGSSDPITASTTISTTGSSDGSGSSATTDDPTSVTGESESDSSGGTGTECATTWRTEVPGIVLEEAVLGPDGRVFVVGNGEADGAVLLGFDRCTGENTDTIDVDLDRAMATFVNNLAIDGGAIFVSGTVAYGDDDPGHGYLARVEGTPLATIFEAPLYGSDDADEVTDVAIAASGRVWMSGSVRVDTGMPSVWGISSSAAGDACGFPWGVDPSGTANAIVRNGGGLRTLVVTPTGEIVVLTYGDDTCPCSCTPSAESSPVAVGTSLSAIGSALVIDDQIYVAGWASDTGDPDDVYAVLTWLDADGEYVDAYRENATAADDGYLQLASDGQQVFVAGLDGYTGGGLDTGTARLDALPVPLPTDAEPDWSGAPAGLDYVIGLAVENGADGGLFVAGNGGGEGVIVRCDKTGACG